MIRFISILVPSYLIPLYAGSLTSTNGILAQKVTQSACLSDPNILTRDASHSSWWLKVQSAAWQDPTPALITL
jgi:hypothetical protein